jgi:uncharacterized protein (TIGR02611 family)
MAHRSIPTENAQVSASEDDVGADANNDGKPGRLDKALSRIRANPAGRIALKIGVLIAGTLVVALGLVLVPLPGPGWLIVFGGLAIWSIEFKWARRLTGYVRAVITAWTRWYARQGWPVQVVVGFATLIFVVAVVAGSIYVSVGPDAFTVLPWID